jgi:hypothetical protein
MGFSVYNSLNITIIYWLMLFLLLHHAKSFGIFSKTYHYIMASRECTFNFNFHYVMRKHYLKKSITG